MSDGLEIAGAALLVAFAYIVWHPAALAVAGVALVIAGIALGDKRE